MVFPVKVNIAELGPRLHDRLFTVILNRLFLVTSRS